MGLSVSAPKLKGFLGPLLCSLALHVLAALALLAGGWIYHAPGPQVFQVLLPPSRPAVQLPTAEAPPKRPRQPMPAPESPKPAAEPPKPVEAHAPAAATPTAMPAADSSATAPAQPDLAPADFPGASPTESPESTAASGPDVAPVSGFQPSAPGAADSRALYLAKVRNAIEARKSYPALARRSRQQGTVVVHFHLSSDGRLLDHGIVTSSGRSLLDRAALQALELVGRFPTLPEPLGEEMLAFEVPVVFRLDSP